MNTLVLLRKKINMGKEGFLKGLHRTSWKVGEFLVAAAWEPVAFSELSSGWSP